MDLTSKKISNNSQLKLGTAITEGSNGNQMRAYVVRGDTIIWWRSNQGAGDTYAYNDTVSEKTGIRTWYLVGGYDNAEDRERSSFMAGTIPVMADVTVTSSGVFAARYPRLYFVHADSGVTDLYLSLYDENYTEISQDVISNAGTPLVSKYVYSFDYLRQGGSPISIKSIQFKLIDSGMTAELQYTDGTNNKAGSAGDNFPISVWVK